MIFEETKEFLADSSSCSNNGHGEIARHDGYDATQSLGTKGLKQEQYRLTHLLFQ